jgi:ABC-2 type transport system ATP-binding protein
VALGRALVHGPQLLILDEPAANLDPRARIEFRTLIRELAADGKTILLSSHILTELTEMCDTVTVIEKGRILASGTVREIVDKVRQRRRLSVRSSRPDAGLERFLLEQPGVSGVHESGGRLQFELDGNDEAQVQLIGRLIAAGFPVLEFSAHAAGLEDVFIEITNGRVQ